MNEPRQNQIRTLLNETFTAINKLSDIITEEDLKWANKNWEKNEFAQQLSNLAEDLIDNGKQFYLYED